MLHITGEVSFGSILTLCTLIGLAVTIGRKLGDFETTLTHHAATMADHAARLAGQEARMIDLVSHVQRLIGQLDGHQPRTEAQRQ